MSKFVYSPLIPENLQLLTTADDLTTDLDDRYVNVTGGTMTGALVITPTADTTAIFQVNQADTTPVFNVDTTNAQTIFNGVVDTDAIVLKDGSTKKASPLWGTNTVTLDIFNEEPTNKISNGTFETDLTGWDIGNTEETNANGDWVLVPGDPDFGTGGAFYVMKYEAKAWDTDGGVDAVVADGGYSSGAGWAGTNSQTRYEARSVADGRPWVYIAQNHSTNFDAQEACAALGSDYHLINNNEWMTIARNVTQVDSNWTNGVVGDGALFRGNSNSGASLDGSDPLTGINTRTLTLDNGNVVWDLAGNVWNWTDDIQSTAINTTGGWVEWNHINVTAGAIDTYGPSNGYLSAQGMGQIYGGAISNAFLRGGRWDNGANAGVFAFSLGVGPTGQYGNLGFRCASDPVAISHSTAIKYSGTSSMKIDNGSPIDTRIVQSANVGDTSTYTLIAYAYTDGSAVTSADLELWYDSAVLSTSYTSVGGSWYRLSGTLTGVASSKSYGVQIKAGKTVYVDNISVQSGVGTTQTFNVTNSGTGTVKTNFEDTVTINGGSDTQQLIVQAHSAQTTNLVEYQKSDGTVQLALAGNGRDFVLDTTTGTKIGTATSQKLGFFNVTPVVQTTGVAAQKTDYTTGDLDTEAEIIAALNTANTATNTLRTALNALGLTSTV